MPGRGGPQGALSADAAAAYLADPAILHWVAEEDGALIGHLLCYVERRLRGIGRALLDAMDEWMLSEGVHEAWVLADHREAEAFYAACGFVLSADQPVAMERRRD